MHNYLNLVCENTNAPVWVQMIRENVRCTEPGFDDGTCPQSLEAKCQEFVTGHQILFSYIISHIIYFIPDWKLRFSRIAAICANSKIK